MIIRIIITQFIYKALFKTLKYAVQRIKTLDKTSYKTTQYLIHEQ